MKNQAPSEESIFQEALRIGDPEQRAAYLLRACGSDAPLRQAVERLLQESAPTFDFLEQPPSGCAAVPAAGGVPESGSPGVAPAERPGDRIGPYKLLERLGEGGCGVVYMAEQTEPIRRRVALKVIKLGMDTREVIARFEAERQALALMDHPNIAQALDAGATGTGRPYFVMELVRGIKITEYCDQAKLPTGARLELFIKVCHAVQHAHQKGIIHRDIKPSNVLVTLHDGEAVPKVIDFGIAKATGQQRLTDKTLFTAFRQFIGTPAYMSPEQAEMSGLDIDTRSDIYSLGVLLYELLTGRTPFGEQELLRAGYEAMLRTIREQEPIKPSTRLSTMLDAERTAAAGRQQTDPARLIHLLRGDLDWIVMKCLEKDRRRRYETANGVAADVQRHLRDEPVVASPASTAYRLQKVFRRHKLAFVAAGTLAVSLAAGFGLSTVLWLRERAAREVARAEAQKSREARQFLEEMLEGVTPAVAKGREVGLLRQILDKSAARASLRLVHDPGARADLQTIIGNVYASLGEYSNSEAILSQAVATRQQFLPNSLELAESLDARTLPLWKLGRMNEAEAAAREALKLRRRMLKADSQEVATSLNNLGVVLGEAGKLEEASTALTNALAIQKGLSTNDEQRLAETLTSLSTIRWKQRRLKEAEDLDREALARYRKLWEDSHPDVAVALNNLGTVLQDEGKFDEAIAVHRKALEIQKKLFAHEHQDMATSLHNLAKALWNNGALAEAEDAYRQLLVLWPKLDGPHAREEAMTLNNLGTVLTSRGQLPEAEAIHRQALELQQQQGLTTDIPGSLNNLATVLLLQKQPAQAEKLYAQSIALLRQAGDQPADLATCLRSEAVVLRDLGRLEDAQRTIQECLDLCEKESSLRDNWRKFDSMSVLGGIMVLRTNYASAERLLLEGNSGLLERAATVPAGNKPRIRQTLERLANLYAAWDKPGQAEVWNRKLAEFDSAQGGQSSPAR